MRIQRAPEKSQKYIGFLSNAGPNPLKNNIDTKPAFNVGPFNSVSLAGR